MRNISATAQTVARVSLNAVDYFKSGWLAAQRSKPRNPVQPRFWSSETHPSHPQRIRSRCWVALTSPLVSERRRPALTSGLVSGTRLQLIFSLTLVLLMLSGCAEQRTQSALHPASPAAEQITWLWWA